MVIAWCEMEKFPWQPEQKLGSPLVYVHREKRCRNLGLDLSMVTPHSSSMYTQTHFHLPGGMSLLAHGGGEDASNKDLLWAKDGSEILHFSGVGGVDFLQVGQSPLGARVRLGDPTPKHLLPPLLLGGLLEAAASGFDGKQAGGQSCQDAAPAVDDQRQIDRRLQHHLGDEGCDEGTNSGHSAACPQAQGAGGGWVDLRGVNIRGLEPSRNKSPGDEEQHGEHLPPDTEEEQKAAEGEDQEGEGHRLLAADPVNHPQGHQNPWEL
ncbi:PREDICTED: uncharacterized protein LOC106551092 [Thamnophis sirtalis]|uniref:Uncharacterized protein LOC106551092 n=1 Tax=Thamnophis sirtalis TaxID=35019 RepID=A0A6I9YJN4_9SAUR|nr:PREDICTED: uncharacterized protein LOC106551092 [Thamnophis sirtalis]